MSPTCPGCYRDGGAGPWCDRTCDHPACDPCIEDRWAAAHPLEAAYKEACAADDVALRACELGWEDWPEYEAEAAAAWRDYERLQDEEREARWAAGKP
jgi:hypothetical protein